MLGLRDTEKRIYHISTDEVSQDEYEYCQVLHGVLWGDKGLVETLGPTWNMVHDSRFENLERKFITSRPAVFGGDARLGVQYVDGDGLLSHSMIELESYAEILGEGRHFHEVVSKDGLNPRDFYVASVDVLWKYIRQECPNYFDNKAGQPNRRATRLFELFRADLLGLIEDYAEVALLQDWVKLNDGERAEQADFLNVEDEPIVWAEVDYFERALSMRASLRVSAVKVLQRSGLLELLETKYDLTDMEIDEVLKLTYQTPYEKLYEIPAKVMAFVATRVKEEPDTTKRMMNQCRHLSDDSKKLVARIKTGEVSPLSTTDEDVHRELSPEERQILAIQGNPYRLELFLMFVEAEKAGDTKTQDLIKPIIENVEMEVGVDTVVQIKEQTRTSRVANAIKGTLI